MLVQMNIERQSVIQRGNLTIDPQCCTVTLDEEEISLYPKEFDALCLFIQYPGWVLSPEQIYEAVWKESVAGCEHVIYNVICQLRRKLKNPGLIQTMVGRGYRFVGEKVSPGAVQREKLFRVVLLFSNSTYEAVWKEPGDKCQTAVVNVVSSIKRKIGDGYIETVVGSGYRFMG